ncbi:MAG: acyl-CoA dehydrogenase [Deltaproteobacteria bacterium]|nr:acyl-CoA dehydrogenase [Deltaproteobacteria bacterium]
MADFIADLRDVKFALFDALDMKTLLSKERFADFDEEDFGMVLDEAFKFARDTMGPTNEIGDREGCSFDKGVVKVPEAFRLPYKLYSENGWLGFSADPDWGGSGMPTVVQVAANDMVFGANMSLALGLLLTPGAGKLAVTFGTDELKKTYCEKLFSGQWMGTMCLTEAQAGTDVGACTTKAVKEGDHYKITGDKVFITFGDHDLAENIVHAVLARVEGAPKGSKGLSLFMVPKFRPKADGSVGENNDVVCAGIEHKLGINGSPTCQLTFGADDNCHGWIIGEEGGGMRGMFQSMWVCRAAPWPTRPTNRRWIMRGNGCRGPISKSTRILMRRGCPSPAIRMCGKCWPARRPTRRGCGRWCISPPIAPIAHTRRRMIKTATPIRRSSISSRLCARPTAQIWVSVSPSGRCRPMVAMVLPQGLPCRAVFARRKDRLSL